ncbi:MAG: hypothetical protein ACON4V_00020 [Parvibaculales bacterium]
MYYMLNLNMMFQCGVSEQEHTIEFVLGCAARSLGDLTANASLIDKFIIDVATLRADSGEVRANNPLGPVERTIFWHNFRTDATPGHYSLRLEDCVNVILNVLGTSYNVAQLRGSVSTRSDTMSFGRARFYDTSSQPWPIAAQNVDPESMQERVRPLGEDELRQGVCSQQRCLNISTAYWDEIVEKKLRAGDTVLPATYKTHRFILTIPAPFPLPHWRPGRGG